jgi:uncharacterized protein (DUF305 family)
VLSGTVSTVIITLGAPRIGRDRGLDWMEIGTVLLRADSIQVEPQWWNLAAGVFVHQAADLSWALVFFALGRRLTGDLAPGVLLILAMPWAALTAGIEYYVILPRLQPLVIMQVPFWTALGVHVTSGLLYPFYPHIRALVTRERVRWSVVNRGLAAVLATGVVALLGLELLARADREPRWPMVSAARRASDARFLREMTAHHTVGVELARLAASNAGDTRLQRLGRLMVANQAGEIAVMSRWWRSWNRSPLPPLSSSDHAHLPGMPHPAAIPRLSTEEGQRFDADFVPVMIDHHRGALQMADRAWSEAADPRVRLLADSIRHAQARQISAMTAVLNMQR